MQDYAKRQAEAVTEQSKAIKDYAARSKASAAARMQQNARNAEGDGRSGENSNPASKVRVCGQGDLPDGAVVADDKKDEPMVVEADDAPKDDAPRQAEDWATVAGKHKTGKATTKAGPAAPPKAPGPKAQGTTSESAKKKAERDVENLRQKQLQKEKELASAAAEKPPEGQATSSVEQK